MNEREIDCLSSYDLNDNKIICKMHLMPTDKHVFVQLYMCKYHFLLFFQDSDIVSVPPKS